MAITKAAIRKQQAKHTYFFFSVPSDKISAVLAALPSYARVSQFTASGFAWSAWGQFHGDRDTLLQVIASNGGYGFYTKASFMGDE